MSSRTLRHGLVSALIVASMADGQPMMQDNLAGMDLSTAQAVPTTCTADQVRDIYKSCISQCESSIPAQIQCDDVNTRYMLVKCAAEADKCGTQGTSASGVVRQAQVKRIADVCINATTFPLSSVQLVFASAAEVASSASMIQQAEALTSTNDMGVGRKLQKQYPKRNGMFGPNGLGPNGLGPNGLVDGMGPTSGIRDQDNNFPTVPNVGPMGDNGANGLNNVPSNSVGDRPARDRPADRYSPEQWRRSPDPHLAKTCDPDSCRTADRKPVRCRSARRMGDERNSLRAQCYLNWTTDHPCR
jgi:hypothetical protein